jgi:vitamin B12 transporter
VLRVKSDCDSLDKLFINSSSFHFQPFTLFSTLNFFIMKKEQKVWAISLIAFGWLAPNLVLSQQDSLRTTQLSEVVITASKFPKSKNETGKVLTVIDAEELSRAGGKDLAQILNEQVGLVINGANSNAGKDKSVYLRGAKSEYTLILIDGIPLADPSSVSGGAYDLRLLSLDQVERIEIMKGSQSTLYGTDAMAGVINIITKTQSEKPITTNASIAYGTYNTLQTTAGVAGNVQDVNYRIGYSRFSTDGISEARESGPNNFD